MAHIVGKQCVISALVQAWSLRLQDGTIFVPMIVETVQAFQERRTIHLHGVPLTVHGHPEGVQLVTQRALHDPHQQGEFLSAIHQYEAAARQNIANTLASNSEAHNYNALMQIRQLEQETDARFSQRQKTVIENLSEVTSEARRRDEQVHGLRTEVSLHALPS